jgi:hypothetical protein
VGLEHQHPGPTPEEKAMAELRAAIEAVDLAQKEQIAALNNKNEALSVDNLNLLRRVGQLEAIVFVEEEDSTTSTVTTSTTFTATSTTTKRATAAPDLGFCATVPLSAEKCAPLIGTDTDGGGVELRACCGDVVIHSSSCSVDPCQLKAELDDLKQRVSP